MMKISKRLTAVLLSLLAACMILPMSVLAAGSIELNKDVSLTISYRDGDTPLAGAEFDIYLVATVDEYGELTTTETFQQFNVDIRGKNDEAWRELAATLEGYVLRDQIPPTDSGKTDENGLVTFPNTQEKLTPGLYLVISHRHTQDGYYYDASPFMMMLPSLDKENNTWIYDVTANAKHDSEPVPEEPKTITRKVLKVWKDEGHEKERPKEIEVQLLKDGEVFDTVTLSAANDWRYIWDELDESSKWTVVEKELEDYTVLVTQEGTTFVVTNTYDEGTPENPEQPENPDQPGNPTLPQTGQLWWPVPVLVAGGLLLIVIGVLRRRGNTHEK